MVSRRRLVAATVEIPASPIEAGGRAWTSFAAAECSRFGAKKALAMSVAREMSWDRRMVILETS
jgi:hypothetical protein